MARKKQVAKLPARKKPAKKKARKAKPKLIALRTYAKHRRCSPEAVRRAIQSGRLSKSVTTNDRDQPKITSMKLADEEWRANTRTPSAPTKPPAPAPEDDDDAITLPEARRRREIELWRQARIKREVDDLDLGQKKSQLIPVYEARETVIDAYTIVKTRVLGVPTACRQQLPHLTVADIKVIEDLVREALEELAADAAE